MIILGTKFQKCAASWFVNFQQVVAFAFFFYDIEENFNDVKPNFLLETPFCSKNMTQCREKLFWISTFHGIEFLSWDWIFILSLRSKLFIVEFFSAILEATLSFLEQISIHCSKKQQKICKKNDLFTFQTFFSVVWIFCSFCRAGGYPSFKFAYIKKLKTAF